MKESIGNAAIFALAIGFIGVISAVFLSSLNYTKAFKIKNRLVDIIEQYDDGYSNYYNPNTEKTNREAINEEIEEVLGEIGYRVNTSNAQCPTVNLGNETYDALNSTYNYRYCIYELPSKRGHYYKVTAYMYLDIPVIGAYLQFPVSGETKVFYHVVDEHGRPDNE